MSSPPPAPRSRRRKLAPALGVAFALSPAVLLVPPGRGEQTIGAPRAEITRPLDGGWVRHEAELVARMVDLGHRGVHTHANWAHFDLPFDPADRNVRAVRLALRTLAPSDVGALRVGPLCLRAPTTGSVADPRWTKLTSTGGAGTRPFWEWDGELPESGARTLLVSVPTRVANAAACWLPDLARAETWRLDAAWESR